MSKGNQATRQPGNHGHPYRAGLNHGRVPRSHVATRALPDRGPLRAIVERLEVKLDRDAARVLHEVANYWTGHLRTVVNAVRVARLLAGDGECSSGEVVLTGQHVADALRLAGKTATSS